MLFSAQIHPAIFLPAVFSSPVTIVFVISSLSLAGRSGQAGSSISYIPGMFMCFSGLLIFYTLLVALQALIVMLTTEFAVTDRRVIAKSGFIRRRTLEMLLASGQAADVEGLTKITNSLSLAMPVLNTTARTYALFNGTDGSLNDPLDEALDGLAIFLEDRYLRERNEDADGRGEILTLTGGEDGLKTGNTI